MIMMPIHNGYSLLRNHGPDCVLLPLVDNLQQNINLLLAQIKKKKINLQTTIFYFSATISSPRSNGARITSYKSKGEQKIIFLSSSDKLNNLS